VPDIPIRGFLKSEEFYGKPRVLPDSDRKIRLPGAGRVNGKALFREWEHNTKVGNGNGDLSFSRIWNELRIVKNGN